MSIDHPNYISPPGPFPVPMLPMTGITPFTYRDGYTYLNALEELRRSLNKTMESVDVQNQAVDDFRHYLNLFLEDLMGKLVGYTIEIDELTYRASMMDGSVFESYTIAGVDSVTDTLTTYVNTSITAIQGEVAGLEDRIGDDFSAFQATINQQLSTFQTSIDQYLSLFQDSINQEISDFKASVTSDIDGLRGGVDSSEHIVAHTAYGIGDGTGNDYAKVQQAVNTMPEGATLTIPADINITLETDDKIVISRPVNIRGGSFAKVGGNNEASVFEIRSNDVSLDQMTIVGPGVEAFHRYMSLIQVPGEVGSPISNISLTNLKLSETPGRAITLRYVHNFVIENCDIDHYRYAGISMWSSSYGHVTRNRVARGRSHSSASHNCYGISVSCSDTAELSERSSFITVSHNTIIDNPNWEGVETHSGVSINFLYNTIIGVHRAISLNAHMGRLGGGPTACRVIGNFIDSSGASTTIFPDPGIIGISFNGGTVTKPDAIIKDNTILNTETPIRYRPGNRDAYNVPRTIVKDNVTNLSSWGPRFEAAGMNWDSQWEDWVHFGVFAEGYSSGTGNNDLRMRIIREGDRTRLMVAGSVTKQSTGTQHIFTFDPRVLMPEGSINSNHVCGMMLNEGGQAALYLDSSRRLNFINNSGTMNQSSTIYVDTYI